MSDLRYAFLAHLSANLDGIEDQRLRAQARYRSFVDEPKNEYDTAQGLAGTQEALILKEILDGLSALERHAIGKLEAAVSAIFWAGAFVESRKGVGLKGIGRILGAIGNPAWNADADRMRRGPAELWAYCGYHTIPARDQNATDPQCLREPGGNIRPRRQKGAKCTWNPRAKSAVFCAANSACRQGHYLPVYAAAREKAATKLHVAECRNRVRPPGKPNGCATVAHPEWGEAGSPWRPGHQHQHAISMVGKQLLLDLFVESRRPG